MGRSVVFMGVAGCGKSTLAAAVARVEGLRLVERDEFHSAVNRDNMSRGIALNDEDRDGWLLSLGEHLKAAPNGIALTCSALKRAYRDRLREASPGLQFVFLDLTDGAALARVRARASHFFSPGLLASPWRNIHSQGSE